MFVQRLRAQQAVERIRQGFCPCPRCAGRLTDPRRSPHRWRHCKSCGCAWRPIRYNDLWLPVAVPGEDCDHWSGICSPRPGTVPIYDEWGGLAGYRALRH